MATESPVRMLPGGGMRGGMGGLSDNLRAAGGGAHSSSPTRDGVAHELNLLLRGRGRYDNLMVGRDVPQRSGSAPPSVEGSFAAVGGLLTAPSPAGLPKQRLMDAIDEQEVRSDPAYLAYYYAHINLNPRLPPPLINWENGRLAQRLSSGVALGGIGDKRKGRSLDDSSSKSLFSTQPLLPTHNEEPEHLDDENSPLGNLLRQTSSDWAAERGGGGLIGLSNMGLGARPKSLVDLIQEDFPRTPSPVYNHSRSSSRAANEEGVEEVQLTHLREAGGMGTASVAELSAVVAGLSLSRSSTPNPQIHGSSGVTSTVPTAPIPRLPTAESPMPRTASPGSAMMAAVSGLASGLNMSGGEIRTAAELAAALQGFNLSESHGPGAVDEHENLHQHQQQEQRDHLRLQQHHQQQQQQRQQQRAQIAQAQAQAQAAHSQAVAYSQAIQQQQQQQQVYSGLDQGYRGQVKFGVPTMTPPVQPPSAGMQPGLQAGAAAAAAAAAGGPNMYAAAAAAAAMSYMAAGNPYYQNMHSAAMYTPQYGLGGYPMNPAMIAPMMAGYPAPGALPVTFDSAAAAAVAASMGVRAPVPGSPGSGGAVDMQHLYKFSGQPGAALSGPLQDPFYLQYMRAAEESARVAAALNDPSVMRGYVSGSHVDVLELQKNQLGTMLGYASDQKSQYSRSGTVGVPSASKSGSVSPAYYGSPPNVGLVLPYPNSPLASPVLPGSPVAPASLSARRDERNLRLASGASRSASAGPSSYAGWQTQRGSEAGDEIRGSSLLEEFKNSKTRRFELSDIAGHVGEFSADQHGSRFIQQKLETASPEEKSMVFQEVLPRALTLMTDVFGNYVIQKFFEHGTAQQRRDLASQLVGHVLALSLQMYGCRVIQKALEVVVVDQQTQLVSELDGHVMRCVRDQNGNHVIQKCIECVPPDRIHFIISAFYGQVVTLSTHPYGCRVIQRVLEHCTDEQKQRGIMEEILRSTCNLAMDQYGNYVVQHVLEHGRGHERSEIITKLAGQIVQMSQHKFASNVIEKCLEFGGPDERQILINEMLGSTDDNEPLQAMMKDQFANYVVQKVLETCDEQQREMLLSRIRVHLHALKKYTYGKHIVARVEKLVAAGERRSAAYMAHLPA